MRFAEQMVKVGQHVDDARHAGLVHGNGHGAVLSVEKIDLRMIQWINA
jgi:hypothetical protein